MGLVARSSEPKHQASGHTNVVLRLHGKRRAHKFRAQVININANCEWPGNVVFDPGSYRPREARQPSPVKQLIHRNGAIYQAHAREGTNEQSGVLVLSRFTGAARELLDAVLVNPYDIQNTAEAICHALEMEPEERAVRMRRLRKLVKEQNIYRWAGNLVAELCEVRLDRQKEIEATSRAEAAAGNRD